MNGSEPIQRFSRWVGSRPSGTATLTWSGGSLVLHVVNGRVVGIEGLDPVPLRRLGAPAVDGGDALEAAIAVAASTGRPEAEAVGLVKEMMERALGAWLLDPGREFESVPGEAAQPRQPSISLHHALVELVLGGGGTEVIEAILPDLDVVLRRTDGFLEGYASLGLTEEADLVAAKVTGQRTAEEIASRSPHDREEVIRLLAALTLAGLLEAVPVVRAPQAPLPVTPADFEETPRSPRKLPAGLLVGLVALLVLILVAVARTAFRSSERAPVLTGHWGITVDYGCEPEDLQRILRKAGRYPDAVRALRTDPEDTGPCWQLVYGDFDSSEAAEKALPTVPQSLREEDFEPTVVPIREGSEETAGGTP